MAVNGQMRRSVDGVRDAGFAVFIDNENQREFPVWEEGWGSAGSAKLDAGLGVLPAQGGRADAVTASPHDQTVRQQGVNLKSAGRQATDRATLKRINRLLDDVAAEG